MAQNSGLSFLSRFDPNEFYDLAKDLPTTIELAEHSEDSTSNNVEVIGTHLLVPQTSISQVLNSYLNTNEQNSLIEFDAFQNIVSPLDSGPPTSNLPSIDSFSGPYNFNISILSSEAPVKKSTSWTFSHKLNKLYCHPNVACPIDVSVSSLPPSGSIVRATPVFSKYEHIEQIVTRCENHKKSKEFDSDVDLLEPALCHFIRCRHSQAVYEEEVITRRQSVTVPFEKPQTGSAYSTILYQFMCYSSCVGGSQKQLRIVLTLEYNGEILGRSSFEIKICACPGRDRATDENKYNKNKKLGVEKAPVKTDSAKLINSTDKEKKNSFLNLHQDDNEEIFTLVIKGRKNYEILKNLNEALRVQDLYTRMKKNENSNGQLIKTGSILVKKNSEICKRKFESIKTLEEFLENVDMSAYYNTIISKGIKDLPSLLATTKKKLNSLKISQSDTNKLWDSIQTFKNSHKNGSFKRTKTNNSESFNSIGNFDFNQSNLITDSFLNPSTDKYIRLSKYQVKYTLGHNQ
ncbi:tumor 63 isoform X7 [Brachionus plicatilis]|uniref:Tumor 63 isoform X7 n=1 Tax=Brachionus plicatilis TaxID=10195 RepID=A0A3M7Q6B9_BRAPC|nr:tumor 63 isoform X7 [Brachionus plicatilis]